MAETQQAHSSDSIDEQDPSKLDEKKTKSRRPASMDAVYRGIATMLTRNNRYGISTAEVKSMAVSRSHEYNSRSAKGANQPLLILQTDPHTENCPPIVLRHWYHLCADRRSVAMGECAGQLEYEHRGE